MLAVVARTEHRSLMRVAREPYHETLAAFAAYEDVERLERVVAEFRDIAQAVRVNHAFAAPDRLKEAHDELLARYAERVRLDPVEAMNAAQALFLAYGPKPSGEVS